MKTCWAGKRKTAAMQWDSSEDKSNCRSTG